MAPKANNGTKPAPPKRPLASFFLYKQSVYEVVKKANPSASICDLTKIIAEQWKLVDKKEKQKFDAQQAAAKKKYENEKKEYEATYGPIESKSKQPKKADTGKAKKSKKD